MLPRERVSRSGAYESRLHLSGSCQLPPASEASQGVRCWVDVASFRRNYPEIAEATDVDATILVNLREEPPLENWDGTTIGAVMRATIIALSAPLALVLAWLWRTRQVAQRG